jgi:hypothetical protein
MRSLLLPVAAVALSVASLAAQRSIRAGEPVHGSLSSSDPQLSDNTYYDEYAFQGRRGQRVTLDLVSDEFDAYLYLGRDRDGRFRELARDDDGGNGTNSRLRYTLAEDGWYVIRASSLHRDTGPYRLSLDGGWGDDRGDDGDDYGRGRDRDSELRANRAVRDYLSRSDDRLDNGEPFRLYRYDGRRGERVTITLRSDDFDAYLVLGTPGGRHGIASALARNDDGLGGTDSRIDFTLPYDGEFVIRVNPMSSGYGRFVLELESDRRGRWGDDHDRPRRGGVDRGLVGLWRLTSIDRYGRELGVLSISASGEYGWRRDGQLYRGRLVREGGDRESFVVESRGEQFSVSASGRGEGLELRSRSTRRLVAMGSRSERRRDSTVPDDERIDLDDDEPSVILEDTTRP